MRSGEIVDAENGRTRSYAFIGGRFQEVEMHRTDEYGVLKDAQVLLIKDFILEDPQSRNPRQVDVPSPVAGYVGRVDAKNGVVEIHDRQGGDVMARLRHMSPIAVSVGDNIEYGQSLGIQNNTGLPASAGKHVHMEMDTRYYQQYENYVSDLVSGRLPVQAEYRQDVEARPVLDDGTFRLGESNERIRDLQRVMAGEGYRAAGGRPLDQDGVYRPGMQGALLDFQRNHGIPQTGDIDPATLGLAPPVRSREVDRQDYLVPGQPMPPAMPGRPAVPGHPDHSDHRPGLPNELEPAVNLHGEQVSIFGDPQLDRLAAALFAGDEAGISKVCAEIERSPDVQALIRQGHDMLAAQEREYRQQEPIQQHEAHMNALSRG